MSLCIFISVACFALAIFISRIKPPTGYSSDWSKSTKQSLELEIGKSKTDGIIKRMEKE